jgi:hypothetical protein
MTCIQSLLGPICSEIEGQLKPALGDFFKGMIVRGYLPQTWVFETESESTTLTVDATGNTSLMSGASQLRDVTIRWHHDLLRSVLQMRNRSSVPSGQAPQVICHTQKGQTAFNFLRQRLGL